MDTSDESSYFFGVYNYRKALLVPGTYTESDDSEESLPPKKVQPWYNPKRERLNRKLKKKRSRRRSKRKS